MKVLLVVAVLAGCGTPPPTLSVDAGACVAYASDPGLDLMTPTISFKTDVMPVLTASCSSASCHGVTDSPQGGLFLGAELKHGADAATVYTSLVGPTARELGSMPYVTKGQPSKSYLMHKLDGDQCMYENACANQSCEDTMPRDGQLPVATRDIVRRWIAQGAANN